MRSFFKRLFNLAEDTPEELTRELAVVTHAPTTSILDFAPVNLEQLYLDYLLSNIGESIDPAFEKIILASLERLDKSEFSGSNLIPRVPSVLPQLLKSLRDENVTGGELAQHISKDVVLVAELIREVNSPYYSPAEKIYNLDNAIQVLGQNGLRLLVARVAFKPIISMQSGFYTKSLAPKIWDHTEKSAFAAKYFAQTQKLDPFPAFLAGMLMNVGTIVAFRIVDRVGGDKDFPRSSEFIREFTARANQLSLRIGKEWDFPDQVILALESLYNASSELSPLSNIIQRADQISKLRVLLDLQLLPEGIDEEIEALDDENLKIFNQLKTI